MSKTREQGNAIKRVELAIKRGDIARGNRCEICGSTPPANGEVHTIVGHHWKGYAHPLDVVWVCRSCNGFLDVHDGSLDLEQMRLHVIKRQWAKLGYLIKDNDPRLRKIASRWQGRFL